MNSIRIKNLRCLFDTGDIPIKPLTILVGANSTGKSTFLRVFPLLRQSVETKTSSPILWYAGKSGYVDFGTIKGVIRASEKSVSFGYRFEPTGTLSTRLKTPLTSVSVAMIQRGFNIEIELIPNKDNESQTKISKLTIDFNESHAVLVFDHFGKVIRFDINKRSFLNELGPLEIEQTNWLRLIPKIVDKTDHFQENYTQNLVKLLAPLYHQDTSPHAICEMLLFISGTEQKDFTNELQNINNTPKVWQNNLANLTDEEVQLIRDVSFACLIPSVLQFANDDISQFAKMVQYIAPSRAIADRFYRTRDISVAEIEPHGENLPMYIHSLSSQQKDELNEWLKKYFNIEVSIRTEGMHLEIMVTEQGNTSSNNIADIGFGYSEILPVILTLWASIQDSGQFPSIIAIEQPELHLHPQLQAQLADVLVQITQSGRIPIMIETHGEAIIDRIGQLIEDCKAARDDIQVLLFEADDENGGIKVRVSQYDEDGCLVDWPYGFFTPNLD
jgi:predicted ATPase